MTDAPPPATWSRDGADWPNRQASRFLRAGGLLWHVQVMGAGPVLLLIHGTGSATHSWRDMAPVLARDFTVVAPDLPGHGFTQVPAGHRLSLPGMARDLAALLRALTLNPAIAAGHSAGAPILARMSLDDMIQPAALVSLNGAFIPPSGPAGQIFGPLAKLLVGLPVLPQLFAWRAGADPGVVRKLLDSTGSTLDEAGMRYYARLVRNPEHAAAALRMMANWDLAPVMRDLPRLVPKLLLVVGERDRTIPPAQSARVRDLVAGSRLVSMRGLGHLAHEEAPGETAALILEQATLAGVLPQ